MLRLDGIVFTLINLLILYAALRHFLIGPIQSVLEQRKQMIDGQFASAAGKEEQAMQLKGQYRGIACRCEGGIPEDFWRIPDSVRRENMKAE